MLPARLMLLANFWPAFVVARCRDVAVVEEGFVRCLERMISSNFQSAKRRKNPKMTFFDNEKHLIFNGVLFQ
jgi:hypothetical protein